MKHYHVTVVPQSSLFLGRDRGNRVVRHSLHYIPASTIGGALNTYLLQVGWGEGLTGHFRFSNLYPCVDARDDGVWLPAPRNLYYCPTCGTGHLVTDFGPAAALDALICQDCRAMCRPQWGVVQARLRGDHFEVDPDLRKAAPPTVRALTVGRTELHRTTAGHVDGRLHMVEILRARGVPFYGDLWVDDAAMGVIHAGVTFRLSIGGLRSRGSGGVELRIGDEIAATAGSTVLLAETPVLALPEEMVEAPAFRATVATPYASVAVSERWAAKPLRSGKGLVSFLDTLAVGSALIAPSDTVLGERMFFYRLEGSEVQLYGFDRSACGGHRYHADYGFTDLWTLGYGRLRWLSEAGARYDRDGRQV